ncbi:MAG TPA: GNAT family N-acyltransferase [Terracidiphilus sp.]
MISQTRSKVPLRLAPDASSLVEIALPAGLPVQIGPAQASRIRADAGRYRLRLAETPQDCEEACRLRFKVFNIELGGGLEGSYETGLDMDRYDAVCEHLLVEDKTSRRVVGTYRMQSGTTAARNLGYYSEQEFCLGPYEPLRPGILELGRASIDREHRTPEVLMLLWRGIAQYATDMGLRYLLGCSSLNSNDPAEGWQIYRQLENFRVPAEFETRATAEYACPPGSYDLAEERMDAQPLSCEADQSGDRFGRQDFVPAHAAVKVPKLLKTYLAIGARIAAPPAWDREFRTIDFLTLLDLNLLSAAARHRFLAPLTL